MAFTQRTTFTTDDLNKSKYWIKKGYTHDGVKGVNPCCSGNSGYSWSVLKNCVGYAWGRFAEIMGSDTCNLPTCNANEWYTKNKSSANPYPYGSTPQLGSAIVFGPSYESSNHVAIVEGIHSNGDIDISESGWHGGWPDAVTWGKVHFQTIKKSVWKDSSQVQGFIYNPAGGTVNTEVEQFIDEAKSHVNGGHKFTMNNTDIKKNAAWSTAYVVACAKQVNRVIGNVIPNKLTPVTLVEEGVRLGMGQWFDGPVFDCQPIVEEGMILFFRDRTNFTYIGKYDSDRCGIIYEVGKENIKYVQGDADDNKVKLKSCKPDNKKICGYYRPNWEILSQSKSGESKTPLYTTTNTRKDMMARQICYLGDDYKPSIKSTNIQLAVLNYTTYLGTLYDTFNDSLNIDEDEDNYKRLVGNHTEVTVPSDVKQTGITAADYTANYDTRGWLEGTTQRSIFEDWKRCGKKSDHGIATLKGFYLVALRPVFATTGDVVTIVLEDGTEINAILGDAKGEDAGSKWGHPKSGGKISIVEVEAMHGQNWNSVDSNLDALGWRNKKVKKVLNYGNYKEQIK